MCTEINSAMGLQATAATKRKHEITFDSKDANAYTNCPPPVKTSRWSTPAINNNNNNNNTNNNNNNNNNNSNNYNETTTTTIILGNSTSTNGSSGATTNANANKNTACDESKISANCNGTQSAGGAAAAAAVTAATVSNGNQVTITNCGTTSSEDSIAKLEVVAAVPCEPWNSPEPVDCISKLQAVAVPSDPWGSISTRSTLATTLLSADELDDDDDDFEDDYEEEESIIPTYCPVRYHSCPPAGGGSGGGGGGGSGGGPLGGGTGGAGNPAGMQRSYSPAHGYNTRPNYYSEPFPQQNCSRTGNQHLRMGPGNGFTPQWGNSAGQNGFYVPPEAAYPPPQQTIRCAENGKSYLELGCSPASFSMANQSGGVGMVAGNSNGLDARHPLKRCCDGRAGTWCNTNKNCYKDVRLKIRNLSMFKLSRFRQVSEQSLYRSVLICNTLKYIDREIESEAKEMHQQQQQQQHHLGHHPHQSHLHHHVPHHGSHHNHHHNNSHHHHQQQQQPQPHQQHQQHQLHQQQSNNGTADYSPVMGCARVTNLDYHQHQQQQQQHNQFHSQPQATDNRNGDCTQQSPYMNAMSKSGAFNAQPSPQQQHPHQQHPQPPQQQQQHQHLQQQHCTSSDSLHPYDHYPFRESQSGRATPFPSAPSSVTATPVTPVSSTTTTSDNDSGYGEDDSNRSINWSSVLSLSSQSALDPLNNNDLFTILPPATSSTSPPAAVPVPMTSTTVSISGTFTASSVQSNSNSGSVSTSSSSSFSSPSANNSSTPTTFTTLSTISSSTYSLTSSSASSFASAAAVAASTWEYGIDMELGLGSEFTELVPTCKLSSDDLFKSVSPVSALSASRYSSVHDNELEHPAHIMVGS